MLRNVPITADDYPTMHHDGEGITSVTVSVGMNGRAERCDIKQSSGHHDLDEHGCRLMMSRARYCPATDRKGKTVVGSADQKVKWVIGE